MLKTNFIEQGRRVKESAGGMFYDPSALLAFVRFNFLLRRTLIELMHADLIYIRACLTQLEEAGQSTVNCGSFGLSAAEPIAKIRQLADEWKQPFQKEYTERSVTQAFDKLLSLRGDLERAAEKVLGKKVVANASAPAVTDESASQGMNTVATGNALAGKTHEGGPDLDFETCMEQIWEQLIAAPPSRGRSMTTVKVGGARLLMSSWEVAAFVIENGPAAEDLRRAGGGAVDGDRGIGASKGIGGRFRTGSSAASGARGSIALAGTSGSGEAGERYRSGGESGHQHERLLSALDEAEKL